MIKPKDLKVNLEDKSLQVSARMKLDSWEDCLDSARVTIWKDGLGKEPSDTFKRKMVISEHSPLREVVFVVDINGIQSWVSVHLVRHFLGVEKYVSTQRADRVESPIKRSEMTQGQLVNMRIVVNAQALINISRVRLCHCASIETFQAWNSVIRAVGEIDKIIAQACVPNCVYRGFCSEGSNAKNRCNYANHTIQKMRVTYLERFCEKGCFING